MRSTGDELDRQRAGLEHEREVLAPRSSTAEPGDLGAACRSGRSRRRTGCSRSSGTSRAGRRARSRSSARRRAPGPRCASSRVISWKSLLPLPGELHRHDRLSPWSGRRLPACPRASGPCPSSAGRGSRVVRVAAVLEEVVVGHARAARRRCVEPRADGGDGRVAADDDRLGRARSAPRSRVGKPGVVLPAARASTVVRRLLALASP